MNTLIAMDINLKTQQDIVIVEIVGDIDGKTSPVVQEKIFPLFTTNSKILLDMTQVSYMSSAGLRVLLTLYRQASANDSKLVLVGLSEEVADIMEITGFFNFFTTCKTVETGLQKLNEHSI